MISRGTRWLSGLLLTAIACGGNTAATSDAGGDAPGAEAGSDATRAEVGGDATGGGATDAGTCNAGAIAFPQGGTLAPGTLCDEVYACADDAAGAARIAAAAPAFSCAPGSEPGSTCGAYTCAYRNPAGPATLDATEIADICALTLLVPAPPLRCVVFVAAS